MAHSRIASSPALSTIVCARNWLKQAYYCDHHRGEMNFALAAGRCVQAKALSQRENKVVSQPAAVQSQRCSAPLCAGRLPQSRLRSAPAPREVAVAFASPTAPAPSARCVRIHALDCTTTAIVTHQFTPKPLCDCFGYIGITSQLLSQRKEGADGGVADRPRGPGGDGPGERWADWIPMPSPLVSPIARSPADVCVRLPPCFRQNMALNVADKGFPISVYNRSYDKTEAAVKRAQKEGESSSMGLWPSGRWHGPTRRRPRMTSSWRSRCDRPRACGCWGVPVMTRRPGREAARLRERQGLCDEPAEAQVGAWCRKLGGGGAASLCAPKGTCDNLRHAMHTAPCSRVAPQVCVHACTKRCRTQHGSACMHVLHAGSQRNDASLARRIQMWSLPLGTCTSVEVSPAAARACILPQQHPVTCMHCLPAPRYHACVHC